VLLFSVIPVGGLGIILNIPGIEDAWSKYINYCYFSHYSYLLLLHYINYTSTTVRSGLFLQAWDRTVSKIGTGP
jgi:hypothetical protein